MWMRTCLAVVFAAAFFQVRAAESSAASEVSFEYQEGLIWVQVHVSESPEPLYFLLDSGAGLSVINLPTLRRFGHLRGRRVRVRGVGATTTGYWPQHLSVVGNTLPLSGDFLAVDLSRLSQACNRTVDGLIGADFFKDHVVQIDFAARRVRLLPSRQAPADAISLPLDSAGGALRVPLRVNGGAAQWTRLDTGCAAALHWSHADVQPGSCIPQVSVALTTLVIPTTQTAVQLGSMRFDSVPTGVHPDGIFAGEAGLLGNGLLSRFESVTIDTRGGHVDFVPAPGPGA